MFPLDLKGHKIFCDFTLQGSYQKAKMNLIWYYLEWT